jgi:hypothetical protein
MASKLNLQVAREIRATWKEELHRVHDERISLKALRLELATKYGVGEWAIRSVLTGASYRDPDL